MKKALLTLTLLMLLQNVILVFADSNNTTSHILPPPAVKESNQSNLQNRIDKFIKNFITSAEKYALNSGLHLETSHEYQIVKENDTTFTVTLNQFEIVNPNRPDNKIIFNPITLKFIPKNDTLNVDFILPKKIPIISNNKKEGDIILEAQNISGSWNEKLEVYTDFNLDLNKLILKSVDNTLQIIIKPINGQYHLTSDDTKDNWDQSIKGFIGNFDILLEESNSTKDAIHFGKISLITNLDGVNLTDFISTKKELSNTLHSTKKDSIESTKKTLVNLDKLLSLIKSGNSKFSIEQVQIDSSDAIQLTCNNIQISGAYDKNSKRKKIKVDSLLKIGPLKYNLLNNKDYSSFNKGGIKEIKISSKIEGRPLPKDFFKEIADQVSTLKSENKTDNQKNYEYVYIDKIFSGLFTLIDNSSYEITLKGLDIKGDNATYNTSLASLWLSGGFSLNKNQGNFVRLSTGYSGLETALFPKYFNSLNLHIQIRNLPSIIEILGENYISHYKENPKRFKDTVMGNVMSTLEKHPIIIGAMVSLMGVPQTLTTMDLNVKLDLKSAFKTVGDLDIKIENPDNLMAIAETLTGSPNITQLLTTLFIFGKQENINGKVIETLNLNITPDGRIILNNKDITRIFFPNTKPTAKEDANTNKTMRGKNDGK